MTIDPKFATAKHDLKQTSKSCGIVTLSPMYPESWRVLMTQLNKNGTESPAILFRPMGKGQVYLIAYPRGGIQIIENMFEYQP